MATWGSYFASYVKKTDTLPSGESNKEKFELTSDAWKPVELPSTAPILIAPEIAFKRSNSTSTTKKLYEIPKEFPKEIAPRSATNAARVAKLFGYAAGSENAAPAKSKLGGVVEQALAMEKQSLEARKSITGVSSLFVTGHRGSSENRVTVDPQTSEIVIGLPPDLFANATIVGAEIPTGKEQSSTHFLGTAMAKPELSDSSSLGERQRNKSVGEIEFQPDSVASKTLQQLRMSDLNLKPLATTKTQSVKHTNTTDSKSMVQVSLNNAIEPMLDSNSSQSQESSTFGPDLLSRKKLEKSSAPDTKGEVQKVTNDKINDDTQAMLDHFASQARGLNSVEDLLDEVSVLAKMKKNIKMTSSTRRNESLGMLDFFASQANIANTMASPAATSAQDPGSQSGGLAEYRTLQPRNLVKQPSNAEKTMPTPSRRNKSLELLDFFASQAMSTISEDKPLSQQINTKTSNLATLPEDEALTEKTNLALMPDENTTGTGKYSSKWNLAFTKIRDNGKGVNVERATVDPVVKEVPSKMIAPLPLRSQTLVPTEQSSKVARPLRNRSATTMSQPPTPPFRLTRANTTPSKPTFDSQSETDSKEKDEDEAATDFRERFLEYERQAEQIRHEKVQMENEHNRMLEEMSMFQKEADRIAEEEKAMKKFVQSLESERMRDEENESRKRMEREVILEAEKKEKEKREKENLEREKLLREKEERLRQDKAEMAKLEKEEAERKNAIAAEKDRLNRVDTDRLRAQEVEKERREVEARELKQRLAREEEIRKKKEVEDLRRRKIEARIAEERLAEEELERINTEILRYAEEAEAKRRLMEEEEEESKRNDAERFENERLQKEERLARERSQYQEREDEIERQRLNEERLARQERRRAREEAERLQYEREAAEEEARYYEQQRRADLARKRKEEEAYYAEQDRLAFEAARQAEARDEDSESEDEIVKAERKIREAFAGLAKERGQSQAPAPPVKDPAPAPSSLMKRANTAQTGAQRQQDRGPMIRKQEADVRISRNNTVGAKPILVGNDQPVMRTQTARGRPLIRGGLPSGPKRRD